MYAATSGRMGVTEFLVRSGADVNFKCERPETQRGETALHKAAKAGHSEVATFLAKNGADLSSRNWFGHTAFDLTGKKLTALNPSA
mmetsp:Transcript_62524/g.148189  ORF Transcript_62524/g.148189 Transcript_62524/m.148189 type:complete len:86 (-) Transcript_62524:32-289(-)